MGPNCPVGSRSGSTRNRTMATVLTTPTTRTVGNGPVLPPKSRNFKFTILASIKYLCSDCITTWSICRLYSYSRSFTSRFQICDRTSICWVAIKNLPISLEICHYFTTTPRISVGLHIWMQEVKERLNMNNFHIDHVMVRSKLKYLIGAKAVGTEYLKPRSGSIPAKYPWFYSWSGLQSHQDKADRVFGRVWNQTGLNRWSNPGPLADYPDPLLTLTVRH